MASGEEDRITVRLHPADTRELEALCGELGAKRSEVVRVALRLGMVVLRKDPTKLVKTPPPARLDALRKARDKSR